MERPNSQTLYEAAERFVGWLEQRVITAARGDAETALAVKPSEKFWLGRLASQDSVIRSNLNERGERLSPCAAGMRLLLGAESPCHFSATVQFKMWRRAGGQQWQKTDALTVTFPVSVGPEETEGTFGAGEIAAATTSAGNPGIQAELRVQLSRMPDGNREAEIVLVNTTSEDINLSDTNLYEVSLEVAGLACRPYLLEALPDSFRYDRRVWAYGINGGVEQIGQNRWRTTDAIGVNKARPKFWNSDQPPPDLCFDALAQTSVPASRALLSALDLWADHTWSTQALDRRAAKERWHDTMRAKAGEEALDFYEERRRIARGIELLEGNSQLHNAFRLMNRAMIYAANGRYSSWRPFQFGFLLANLPSIVEEPNEAEITDIVWFATGGGKTETYLGLIVTAAFYDRLRGKASGITAWSRFPLRMLSLQQTQRFANAMAGAERVRLEESIAGDPFSVGFFVGSGATPNFVPVDAKPNQPDPDDRSMPDLYQVLLSCPFCHEESIGMHFNRKKWSLEHRCLNESCVFAGDALPFYVVDDEIYRFLPTVIVGTLDKAALISMQASMRGFVGQPMGLCSEAGHGYVYAKRQQRPNGCLVPGCRGHALPLPIENDLYGPSFRLQDELHLLRDSLGAVDAHYEALLDHLQARLCGRTPKILASSATLTGYQRQVDVLYGRDARVFPVPPPADELGFWTASSDQLMRRYVGVAPRGVTLEYALDNLLTQLQRAIRDFHAEPTSVCLSHGIAPEHVEALVSLYGTDVVYGNSLRDLDAVVRSAQTQIRVDGPVNHAELTGKTDFAVVRRILGQLEEPQAEFFDRIHIIAASSMMSHGVDIDRLNVMCVLGLPLATAEFLQATARVGRRWPGLVFVAHKIGRERDAGVFRSFRQFVEQGDRFVEAIPVTRRSRRILERTVSGLALARLRHIHEPAAGYALTTPAKVREFADSDQYSEAEEFGELCDSLSLEDGADTPLRNDLEWWLERYFRNIRQPGGSITNVFELSPTGGPMTSLRDVDEQVPIYGSDVQ